ncbi:hypothetical protein LCGC14_1741190, partial [marine sediment metagenome]
KDYITELANRLKDNGNYWPSNEHVVDFIAENYPLPGYKKWVRQIRKLGKTAYENAQAAKAESQFEAGSKTMVRPPSDDPLDAPPTEAQFAEEDLTDIPPGLDRRAKFQLLSPKGKTKLFKEEKKFLEALEAEMLTNPVTWWALNGNLALEIAKGNDEFRSWVDSLLDMAVEGGKEDVSDHPMGAG